MQIQILQGDCIDSLKKLEDQSINTCITSPPYWGLRDYNGEEKQLGLEDTPEEFVENLVKVFREVKRVLRDDGTVWLNLGDSYAGNNLRASNNGRAGYGAAREGVFTKTGKGLKAKDLVGIPWRVALALQQDGWYLRQDIIWHKPNPMPESVRDRCTKAHEYIFLLSKSPKYYFDNESIKEDAVAKNRIAGNKVAQKGTDQPYCAANLRLLKAQQKRYTKRNKRSVWTVTTKPFKGAHFATFPMDLIEPCVLAGCPKDGVVLDPFAGSGTTGIVASNHGRNSVLLELNEEYIEIAKKRIYDAVGMYTTIKKGK
jgi:site-specific DNA-methyltransferase (adenine-specific)